VDFRERFDPSDPLRGARSGMSDEFRSELIHPMNQQGCVLVVNGLRRNWLGETEIQASAKVSALQHAADNLMLYSTAGQCSSRCQ
jgi:hypothetical protein